MVNVVLLVSLFLGGQVPPAASSVSAGREVLDLSGQEWQVEGIRPGQGEKEGFHLHFGETASSFFNWTTAEVPGDVYTDLWRAGEIDDPHYGRNSARVRYIMEKEWWYRRQFAVPESWRGKTVRLVFEGVDYACDVWLNNHYLGHHEGMFSPFEFNVSGLLRYGGDRRSNGLVVRLAPPPRSYRNVAGRKFPWHGDYWRSVVPIGIWRPVKLIATGPVYITDVFPKTKLNADGAATVTVEVALAGQDQKVAVQASVAGYRFEHGPFEATATTIVEQGAGTAQLTIRVPEPRLWWPWDLGTPHLYLLRVTVLTENGAVSDTLEDRFGIREVAAQRNPGYTEEEVKYPWTIVINGKPIFLRSANWGGPPDIFYGRNSADKYRKLVTLAKGANINNLRIFGWHPTEIELFYDLCDEMGITVWQDVIPLASVNQPTDPAFREATYREAISVIRRLRRHPSVVLLEGGEEMFYGTQGLKYAAEFLVGLGQAVRPYTDLPYVPTSPLNWPPIVQQLGLGGPKDSAHTHALFYGLGSVLLEDYVRSWDYAVIPEFAVSSVPDVESLKRFIPADELWPPGPSWGHHWADLDAFLALNYQIFGDPKTSSLEEFVKATQVAQGVVFQWGIEHMRRRKPKSSAISICHFITYAPDMKWGIVDYFQRPKLSYDYVRRAYQPVLVCLETERRRWLPGETFEGKLWIVNDYHRDLSECVVFISVLDASGEILQESRVTVAKIPANSSNTVARMQYRVEGDVGDQFTVRLKLTDPEGQTLSTNEYFFLIGDQEKARRSCAELARRLHELRRKFESADYYRFFPELGGEERFYRIGDTPPRVRLRDLEALIPSGD